VRDQHHRYGDDRVQDHLVGLIAVVAIPLLASQPMLAVANQVILYAIIAVPMVLLGGSAGQISIGQAAPVAIGAYTSAITVMDLKLPFLVGLLLAGVVAAVVATVLTLPIWRLTGHYVSIATLGIGFVAVSIIRNWDSVTRGAYGITGVPGPRIGDLRLTSAGDYYWLNLAVGIITLLVVLRLRSSHLGTIMASVGSDEVAARSAGVRTRDYKVLAFAVAAFFAGIAGSLLAHENRYLDPTLFPILMSTLALTIIVVGGITSPVGAVVGSIVLVAVPELLRLTPDVRILLYGVVLIAVIRFRPQGLWVRRNA
ncbi:MAG TPA: branched-chain amino acid ABC transporter permease, partial [Propionibacteriaceae bacterium]|nr:branched-chain amino acid ABC transporter permease [Propionibacteriaceae bacterium]